MREAPIATTLAPRVAPQTRTPPALDPAPPRDGHHFTVDVEEYFHVTAFEDVLPRSEWDVLPSRVECGVSELLDLLARHGARGTFFVLGWVARRHPALVRMIADAGHEVASHGWSHRRVPQQEPEEFRDSVRRTKRELEDLIGLPVTGYRAPSFSIVPGQEWALDVLIEEGHRYDSSLFPVHRNGYGHPGAPRDPTWLACPAGFIAEVPPATVRWRRWSLPAGGGAYFRLLPYWLVREALRDCSRRGVNGTFYIHPWELDPAQPRVPAPWLTRLRHYGGQGRTRTRLERLLREFRFHPIAETVRAL